MVRDLPGMQEALGLIPSTSNTSQNGFPLVLSHILHKPVCSVVKTRQHPQVRRCCRLETPALSFLCLWFEKSLDRGRHANSPWPQPLLPDVLIALRTPASAWMTQSHFQVSYVLVPTVCPLLVAPGMVSEKHTKQRDTGWPQA